MGSGFSGYLVLAPIASDSHRHTGCHIWASTTPRETLLWENPRSPRTSEGFFSFCRDQGDLVFGILEHLDVDVV